ncbi:MAG TPA: PIG-L family deacetylase [Thermoanaerobaculia bacterium]|jgi:LmbE family N-acetylglucosaminyl deacetylase/glycosyltransferase involved in cell wall biosynthesis
MALEADAIPFEPSRLRGERLLVLAPHPDDEVIGCGGLVAQHLNAGNSVRVVVATDGGQAGVPAIREEESRKALALLCGADPAGLAAEVGGATQFLGYPDRELASHRDELSQRLASILREYRPDLILVASPIEFHPDHLALATTFCELIQRDETLFADLAVAKVAFYEVGQPLRPNAIVDITDVAEKKYAAIAAHESQLAVRDYVGYARGLNAYRAMTMPREVKFAEAYFVVALPELRSIATTRLQSMMGDARGIAIDVAEPLPISVVLRTKDRPALLREAIDSIRATGYPCEIVVVNDGGARPEIDGVTLIHHERSLGRSEAANAGVRAAKNAYIAFLDDDDLFYADHLATLANAARDSQATAWCSDAVSAFVRLGGNGALETQQRLRLFGDDFDRDALLTDNYIPLPTLLFRRADFLDLGGFDPAFDLFEDWDFLIRLSQRGKFVHVPRVTCEIRHIETAGSITMASPEGSSTFRDAKLAVWRKHASLLTNDVFANALEHQKRRLGKLQNDAVEVRGLHHHLQIDIARLQRENARLIGDIQRLNDTVTQDAIRISNFEGIDLALRRSEAENEHKAVQLAGVQQENRELRGAFDETQTTVQSLYAEVRRLQSILDMIYGSKTWKLHTMVEKVKGR